MATRKTEDKSDEKFDDLLKQLMTPERQEELKKYFEHVPPVVQQFYLRIVDIRDSQIINFIADNDVISNKIADKVYDKLAEYNKPILEKLEKLINSQEELHVKMDSIEIKVNEHDSNLLTIQDDINILKSRNNLFAYTIRGLIYIAIAIILFLFLFPWAHKHLAWFNNNSGRLMTTEEAMKIQNAPTRAIHIPNLSGYAKDKKDSIIDAGIQQDQNEILVSIKARDEAYYKKYGHY